MSSLLEIRNATIRSTMLGNEDHGIFTASVSLEFGGFTQSFGGYALDEYDGAAKRRVGTAYGLEFIKGLLAAVGAESWEKLPGKHVRVRSTGGTIDSIGHIINDKWFTPSELKL